MLQCATLKINKFKKNIQNKYSIDSLIKVLKSHKEWYHFLEGVLCMLRSCYFNINNQLLTEKQDKIDDIKKEVLDNLNTITDFDNIEQLGFATQAIMLITNLSGWLDNQDKDQLSTIIPNLFIKLLANYEVYAIPNAFDFVKGAIFLNQKVVEDNKQLVDNEYNKRDIVLETHQKYLVFEIWKLIKKINLNQLSISKAQCDSNFLKSLNLESDIIEKFIVLFILKYVDIPFDEEFTDELIDILIFLQAGPDTNQINN